jgi:glyoxylase-like metal-dependent hydrolase (beta-lactamase superfamily II)
MNDLENQLTYPLADTMPEPGCLMEVASGVYWIRMGLPFALNHINLWLLRDHFNGQDGWTVVDCCIDKPESRAQWQQIFDNQLQGMPIVRVVCTHMHPDHIGLAHWICAQWNVPLWISATDYHVAKIGCQSTTAFGGDAAAAFFAAHGLVDAESAAKIKARTGYYSDLVPTVPANYRRLLDGMVVIIGGRSWRCISGYGHAPEHIALHCEALNTLISGDMVLPRISTNVSVYEGEPEADSLTQFLDSIDKFKPLPEDTLVLPSHGKPFTGLHIRIAQLHSHHADRLAEVLEACTAKPYSAFEIVPIMFKRPLDLHQMTFAMGEAVAHLHALWHAGKLVRQTDADKVLRFAVL